jgi:exopolyphosphatase/guanosine-5'-triphosphate,3'-diphosphate pyrophosphatase
VHGSTILVEQIGAMFSRLSTLTADEIRRIPTMHPQRADVILAGVLIAARVAARVPVAALTVSESDILDGIALGLLRQR